MSRRYKRKNKPKMETSKVILLVIGVSLAVTILFSMVMMVITHDLSPIDWILTGMYGLAATAVGFYYNKAKAENKIKLKKKYGKELTEGIVDSDALVDESAG